MKKREEAYDCQGKCQTGLKTTGESHGKHEESLRKPEWLKKRAGDSEGNTEKRPVQVGQRWGKLQENTGKPRESPGKLLEGREKLAESRGKLNEAQGS